jgi:heat shock protein HtpX
MAAYGLYTHIQSNRRRSVVLLIGLFFLVYVMVFAGASLAAALTFDAPVNWLLTRAWRDTVTALPFATIGTIIWIVIAYYFHQTMIDAVTGGREVTRREEPRLYNLLENLCISRGIPMPKLKIMEEPALNAFATGLNQRQYSITVTTGLLENLDDAEIEAVLGHELTHIRNGDVRMMVIAVIIAGVVSFFAELIFRMLSYSRWSFGGGSRDGDFRFAQDRGARGVAGCDLGRDGNVCGQSARGIRRSLRHPSKRRPAGGCACAICRRARSRAARFAGTRRRRNG